MGGKAGRVPESLRWKSVFLAYSILGVFFAWLSPYLYIDEALKRAFASFTAPAVSTFLYPVWQSDDVAFSGLLNVWNEGSPRPPITLTLLTDDDLEAYGATYPVKYGFHADRLETIAARNPRAIFIDIAFIDERPDETIGELIETICHIQKVQKIPVFLASLDDANQSLRSDLNNAAKDGCFSKVTVLRQLDTFDRNNWEYNLRSKVEPEEYKAIMDSPALAMFKVIHPESKLSKNLATDYQLDPLGIIWGLSPHQFNVDRMRREGSKTLLCFPNFEGFSRLLGQALEEIGSESEKIHTGNLLSLLGRRNFCPYQASMPLHFLSEEPAVADVLLTNRLVIYGVDLQSVGDYTFSPLHGSIPGAYSHAMALDNLLRFGDAYPRALNFDIFDWSNSATQFSLIMILTISAWMASIKHLRNMIRPVVRCLPVMKNESMVEDTSRCAPKNHAVRQWGAFARTIIGDFMNKVFSVVLWWSVYFIVLIAIGWLAQEIFHLSLLSWIEYGLIPMVIETFGGGESFAAYIEERFKEFSIYKN